MSRVRFPHSASKMIDIRRRSFRARQLSGILCPFTGFFLVFPGVIRSMIVPKGQIHPHQARPNITVKNSVRIEKIATAGTIRLASRFAKNSNGSSWIGKFNNRLGHSKPRIPNSNITVEIRKMYCDTLRILTQRLFFLCVVFLAKPIEVSGSKVDFLDAKALEIFSAKSHFSPSPDIADIIWRELK